MNLPSYSTLQVEAALCIWEAMLELRDELQALDEVWQAIGTVQMRHFAIELAPFTCEVWETLTEEEQMLCVPYDWEFIPALVKLVGWIDDQPVVPNSPRVMADLILDCFRKNSKSPPDET